MNEPPEDVKQERDKHWVDSGVPGFPQLTTPQPAYNDHPALHFETFLPRLMAGLDQIQMEQLRQIHALIEQGAIVQSLLHILLERGVVDKRELDAIFPTLANTLAEHRMDNIRAPKHAHRPEVIVEPTDLDCNAHYPTCEAACCTMFNVFLTEEEASSNKYLWDVAMPYRLLVDDKGACVYFDGVTYKCSIWQDRPTACRTFDCRTDGRIWEDYPARTLSLVMMEAKARQAAARQRARRAEAPEPPPAPPIAPPPAPRVQPVAIQGSAPKD